MRIIACALPCEARAFIDHFKMKSIINRPFKIYQKDDIALVISGIGQLNMTAACAYVYAKYAEPIASWLNIGICGADNKSIGNLFVVNKISSNSSQISWYPPLIIKSEIAGCNLITVDQPTQNYVSNNIYDMEASAFYATCIKFTTSELVSCLKVVSDNAQHSMQHVDKNFVLELMHHSFAAMLIYFEQQTLLLKKHQIKKQAPLFYTELISDFHFTKTQQHQLKRLLARITNTTIQNDMHALKNLANAKQLLQQLEYLLAKQKVCL